jgi:proteic killer suppression protein
VIEANQAHVDSCRATGYNSRKENTTEVLDQGTQDIFDGVDSQKARDALPSELHEKATGLLDRISAAMQPADLRIPRGNRLHRLTEGRRKDQWSVSINDQYRICFDWENCQAKNVEITDYH